MRACDKQIIILQANFYLKTGLVVDQELWQIQPTVAVSGAGPPERGLTGTSGLTGAMIAPSCSTLMACCE